MVPTFTMRSIGQGGAQLYSGSIATSTPQTFNVASSPSEIHGFGVGTSLRSEWCPTRCIPGHIHQI